MYLNFVDFCDTGISFQIDELVVNDLVLQGSDQMIDVDELLLWKTCTVSDQLVDPKKHLLFGVSTVVC